MSQSPRFMTLIPHAICMEGIPAGATFRVDRRGLVVPDDPGLPRGKHGCRYPASHIESGDIEVARPCVDALASGLAVRLADVPPSDRAAFELAWKALPNRFGSWRFVDGWVVSDSVSRRFAAASEDPACLNWWVAGCSAPVAAWNPAPQPNPTKDPEPMNDTTKQAIAALEAGKQIAVKDLDPVVKTELGAWFDALPQDRRYKSVRGGGHIPVDGTAPRRLADLDDDWLIALAPGRAAHKETWRPPSAASDLAFYGTPDDQRKLLRGIEERLPEVRWTNGARPTERAPDCSGPWLLFLRGNVLTQLGPDEPSTRDEHIPLNFSANLEWCLRNAAVGRTTADPKKPMRIDADWLRDRAACDAGRTWFAETFGERASVVADVVAAAIPEARPDWADWLRKELAR